MLALARSLLFVPAHQDRMVEKTRGLAGLDVALLDLEDGPPRAEKDAARRKIAEALGQWTQARPFPLVRINGTASEQFIPDIAEWPRIEDPGGLRRDSVRARAIGFNGKTCIHPSQVEIIDVVVTPSDAEVALARGIVTAFEDAERGAAGAIALDGRMVDRPVVERARRLLRRWELSGRVSA